MNSKILFIDPGMSKKEFHNYINRGLLSIASYAKFKGFETKYTSLNYETNLQSIENKIKDFDVIALSLPFIAELNYYNNILNSLKKSNKRIIVGGYYPTLFNLEGVEVIKGEGEWKFLNLISNEPINNDLNQLPSLDYSLLDIDYLKNTTNINLEFNRGCNEKCSFCSVTQLLGHKVREHPLENLIEEIEQLNSLGYNGNISIEDSTLDLSSNRMKEFFIYSLKLKRTFNYSFITTRYDCIDEESAGLIKKLGFEQIVLGLESGSKKVLDINTKNIKLDEFEKTCSWLKKYIDISAFLIIGLPGENKETLNETYFYVSNLVNKGYISNLFVSYFQPYPKTKATKIMHNYGGKIISKNYDDWIYRNIPLVEYPDLSKEYMIQIFNKLNKLIKKKELLKGF
jgi:anaerobic magnesium-protoporphyrin IX monomethyl ester cyclase